MPGDNHLRPAPGAVMIPDETPGLTPAAELLQHGRELITDLADAVEAIPPIGDEAAEQLAGQFSRLSEDCAEAAMRVLALPARPAERPGHSFAAAAAILTAAETEHDFGAWLADILCRVAAHLGSADHLVMGRSGPGRPSTSPRSSPKPRGGSQATSTGSGTGPS